VLFDIVLWLCRKTQRWCTWLCNPENWTLLCWLKFVRFSARLVLLSLSINLRSLLLRSNFFFYLVFTWIAPLHIKLGVIHFRSCLVECWFLPRTIPSIDMEFVTQFASVDDKVIVRESKSGSFEITVLIAVRTRHCIMLIVVISVVLVLRYGSLLLWTNLFALSSINFRIWTTEYSYRLF